MTTSSVKLVGLHILILYIKLQASTFFIHGKNIEELKLRDIPVRTLRFLFKVNSGTNDNRRRKDIKIGHLKYSLSCPKYMPFN